ncbi:hypothetical protein E4U54_005243 [Claviceps lovelessii]|nr:hypothetical protein E4U54_005243 [Claviceps lovelessii]
MSSTPAHPGTSAPPSPPSPCQAQQPPSRPIPTSSSHRQANDKPRLPFPVSAARLSQPNPSSTSVAPSTAEGKAIPVDDTTAQHRTLALREINSHYPSRSRYVKPTDGRSGGTYSEPVVVRTYYSPASSRHDASSNRRQRQRQSGRSVAGFKAGGQPRIGAARGVACAAFASQSQGQSQSPSQSQGQPFPAARSGMLSRLARAWTGKAAPASEVHHDAARLPPMAAFEFKSFLANTEAQAQPGAGSDAVAGALAGALAADINSDLDRIAEICARSSYSLSNQYEVHYAPHGSGASFVVSGRNQQLRGPTLQAPHAVAHRPGDLQSMTKRQRRGPRRSGRAVGTLETIMSSSRSSDDENAKKKSASELAAGVRGRAVQKPATSSLQKQHVESTSNSQDDGHQLRCRCHHQPPEPEPQPQPHPRPRPLARRPSTALAMRPRASSSALVSEPSLPQASARQLETRTASATQPIKPMASNVRASSAPRPGVTDAHPARGSISSTVQQGTFGKMTLSSITGWLPWTTASVRSKPSGRAESSLRHLLHNTDHKG